MSNSLNEVLLTTISGAKSIAILTHKRPDGDAVASSLATFWYLIDIGKNASDIDVLIPSFNDDLAFIPGINHVKKVSTKTEYDIAIIVDCANTSRIGCAEVIGISKKVICFDHHDTTSVSADYIVVDPKASSCTCIIQRYFSSTNNNFLTCIAIGLLSDTCILTLNVTDECQNIVRGLKSKYVDMEQITKYLTQVADRTTELVNLAIERGKLKVQNKHSIFCTYLLQSDFLDAEKDLTNVNHKAIINEMRKSIPYTSLIFLIENDKHQLKGSTRTFSNVNLNNICTQYVESGKFVKGGGHSYSAGCTVNIENDIFTCIKDTFDCLSTEIFKQI